MTSKVLTSSAVVIMFAVGYLSSEARGQAQYPDTIAALQAAYQNEMRAYVDFLAYADRAKADNFPNLSRLFRAFATAESIHARNFKQVLSTLGVDTGVAPSEPGPVSGTKENLKRALAFEILDIDRRYPQLIAIARRAEHHDAAIMFLTYSWETEKQHRDLIKKMQSGTGIFFGVLTKRIETAAVRYSLCMLCGSTVIERPATLCPVCKSPASEYKELEEPK